MSRSIPAFGLLAILLAAPAIAQPVAADRQADLAKVESYLNGITTAEADFTMASPDGKLSRGKFDLSRPGKLRFEYQDPKGNLLIADGDYIIFWDADQKEASNAPISSTPAAFLLKPHISLTEGVKVTHYDHSAGMIRLSLVEEKDPNAGSVTISFSDQPIALKAWRVADPQGGTTDVTFDNWRLGGTLDAALFHFKAPDSGKRHR